MKKINETSFIEDNKRQLIQFLQNRSIEYTLRKSRTTNSVYFHIKLTHNICIRISSHGPKFKKINEYTIHPGMTGSCMQQIRQFLEKEFKKFHKQSRIDKQKARELANIQKKAEAKKQKMDEQKFKELEVFAWIGEDELGSKEIGIKAALVPAGFIPLVAKDQHKIDKDAIVEQLQAQANQYGKTIRLCRYQFVEEIITLEPKNELNL